MVKEMAKTGCGHSLISSNGFLNHFASFPVEANATNFDSMVECVIHVCFLEVYETAPPAMIKTYLDVDLLSLMLVIHLASVYRSSTVGKLL